MALDFVCVADDARISLGVALNMLIAKKSCPDARFIVALPKSRICNSTSANEVISKYASEILSIPDPSLTIDGKLYRIENKINALRFSGRRRAILVDSDVIFLRPMPEEFLFRTAPAAVPEHGLHAFPWARLYQTVGLHAPELAVLLGSGEASPPWFNAGLVTCPDAEMLGEVWRMMSDYVLRLDWVPERWPYLDQIALPLAIAQLSSTRRVEHESVLPSRMNQNIFYWAGDQAYIKNGFVLHHHNRVRLIERYLPSLITWIRDGYPIVDRIVGELKAFDNDES